MADPVGFLTDHDYDFLTQKPQFKTETASPSTVHAIMREQKAHEAALAAEEERRLAAKREESVKRQQIEREQTQVRIIHQRLVAKLFAQPAKNWDQRQSELFAVICDWLENKQ